MSVAVDPTGMQEDGSTVVVGALEAVPTALDLFDEQVHRLGRSVRSAGQAVGEDLGEMIAKVRRRRLTLSLVNSKTDQ
jgi:hypothetical protein